VISKGEQPDAAGYSAFDGHTPEGASLHDDLETRGIAHVYVGGLATDYCVRASVLDALAAGLSVTVLLDAVAGVDLRDSARAVDEMRARGARIIDRAGSLGE
jgi:nicotinamidase/pyrazinamidase